MTKYFLPRRFLVLCLSTVLLALGLHAQPESNRRMAERLRAITASADPTKSPFEFSARARQLGTSLAQADQTEKMKNALPYANLLLHAGELEAAIGQYEEFEHFVKSGGVTLPSSLSTQLHTSLGLTYLRWGERENCLLNHNADSCLFPIRGGGIHQNERGSRGAIVHFTTQL